MFQKIKSKRIELINKQEQQSIFLKQFDFIYSEYKK